MLEKDRFLWFEVLGGSEAEYQFNTWTETHNVWGGENATINVEIWNRNYWGDEDELSVCGNIVITEIRDEETWSVVKTQGEITQWVEQPIEMWGPPMSYLKFVVPSDLEAKEYKAKIKCEDLDITRDAWFRIASFQTAILMPENFMSNQNISFWVKVTYYNGIK